VLEPSTVSLLVQAVALPVMFPSTNFSVGEWRDWLSLSACSVFGEFLHSHRASQGLLYHIFIPRGMQLRTTAEGEWTVFPSESSLSSRPWLQPTQTLILGFYLVWISAAYVSVTQNGHGFFLSLGQVSRELSIE